MVGAPGDGPFLVVGLGNPGKQYAGNRHNVGAMVADVLAGRLGAGFKSHKAGADVVEGRLGARRVILAKPRSYMNLSGGATAALAKFFSVVPARVIAVHDELDLPPSTIRVKQGGGEGGHNGLRSISASLGTKDYLRVRFGIGRPPGRMDPADFVLRDFSAAERKDLGVDLEHAADAVELLVEQGLEATQNQLHAP
ncbi:aminoacyl-tRNA hydrolase [Nakamurella multipartita]|jgi:PTH1 family peptidyl-tRNA hydrolase|uniref:Peptidyl-tRNA hydrolase n=1 Tax=Nakamurella multipartita (strain ATCC 700099 / DSM 44233 / CIP 104796 / JCM 9543 / NBRC 105858 / Y-104) TaxID=479431 RepID=C8X6T1_NAKMY|nr:aminoacyl-tRNA hydrolase [Nakamurella multipartita]ACV80829.1 peptidyl-tRNA hydrolase [Nakamurella multipartita DSM 44233]HOZ60437.1 aminoacyl-tRNA hydrolase [Nakamurella multipartita]